MKLSKYSVLMSVYSKEDPGNLKESINSMLNQTIEADEIIIVKDGPLTLELENALLEYRVNPKIKVIELTENVGLGLALRVGVKKCKNDIVARMDTDDVSEKNRCEKQLSVLSQKNHISVVGSSIVEFIDSPENIISFKGIVEGHDEIKKRMKYRNEINHPSVMFRKKAVLDAGNYQHWFLNEDYYLWIRMLEKGYMFENIPEPLVKMRINKNTFLRRGGCEYYKAQKRLFDYMLNKGFINIFEYVLNNLIRFITRVILPNGIRKILYLKFLRKKVK